LAAKPAKLIGAAPVTARTSPLGWEPRPSAIVSVRVRRTGDHLLVKLLVSARDVERDGDWHRGSFLGWTCRAHSVDRPRAISRDLIDDAVNRVLAEIGDGHRGALPGQQRGARAADTTAGTGYDGTALRQATARCGPGPSSRSPGYL
jgi:hypothetical protein